jgi:hypothetical protein
MSWSPGRGWRRGVVIALALAASVGGSGNGLSAPVDPTPESRCVEFPAMPAPVAALKPSDVLLAISSPRAGETVVATGGSITVSVDYWGPRLIRAEDARAVDDYHLTFFLDADPTPYIGGMLPVPRCLARVVHTTATRVTFTDVTTGSHALAVLLVGSNSVSVNPPVAARVTFMVK